MAYSIASTTLSLPANTRLGRGDIAWPGTLAVMTGFIVGVTLFARFTRAVGSVTYPDGGILLSSSGGVLLSLPTLGWGAVRVPAWPGTFVLLAPIR